MMIISLIWYDDDDGDDGFSYEEDSDEGPSPIAQSVALCT